MPVDWEYQCRRLGLVKLAMSESMFGGMCPICGKEKSFFVWLDRKPIRAICFDGCKISMTVRDNGRPWQPDSTNGG